MPPTTQERSKLLAINVSLGANVVLAIAKTAVGVVAHSPALLAEGVNSTSDVAYLAIIRVFVGQAGKPPDQEHPFGHRQFESIAAVVVGAFVMTTGIAIFWDAVRNVYDLLAGQAESQGAGAAALWIALGTFLLKILLTAYTRLVARQTGSMAVLALSRDHRNDVFSITAAMIGILLGRAGYVWFDPLAAAAVALLIVLTGVGIIRESSADLMDVFPDEAVERQIRHLLEGVEGVRQVEEIHVHQIGLFLMVGVVLGIDGRQTVAQGDAIASRAEETLRANVDGLRQVSVHYHPARDMSHDQAPTSKPE